MDSPDCGGRRVTTSITVDPFLSTQLPGVGVNEVRIVF